MEGKRITESLEKFLNMMEDEEITECLKITTVVCTLVESQGKCMGGWKVDDCSTCRCDVLCSFWHELNELFLFNTESIKRQMRED